MKVSLLKISRKKEVIKRLELREIADIIRENPEHDKVLNLRLNYQFYRPQRLPDGQIALDDEKHVVNLPRILFAVDSMNYKEMQKGLKYNGLVVVEVNGLKTYEDAVNIRNQAARMDETVMAFLGASGKSVKKTRVGSDDPLFHPLYLNAQTQESLSSAGSDSFLYL